MEKSFTTISRGIFMGGQIFYLTKGKLQELKKEHDELVFFEHSKITSHEIPKILESENLNPEFVSFQEDMNALRTRIEELENILEHYQLIKNPPKEERVLVRIGATVKVDIGSKKDKFTIVGTLEANPTEGKISNESPVGKALLGRKLGDEVVVNGAEEKIKYKIKGIAYEVS